MLPRNRVTHETKIGCIDHRAGDAGAVLAVVNALRFGSTRPAAGPGALTTPARGTVGSYAMVPGLAMRPKGCVRRDASEGIDAAHTEA
jgi:hypothetical protein